MDAFEKAVVSIHRKHMKKDAIEFVAKAAILGLVIYALHLWGVL